MNKNKLKNIAGTGITLVITLFLFAFQKGGIITEKGHYIISVKFLANQVKVGRNMMKVSINDKESRKREEEKLEIEVVPWMPAHQHGTSEIPIIEEKGQGQYLIKRLNFTMSGDWEVYIRINDGIREDTAVFNVNVIR